MQKYYQAYSLINVGTLISQEDERMFCNFMARSFMDTEAVGAEMM
jgi:hypothetical protein